MGIFTKWFVKLWVVNSIYNSCLTVKSAKPYIYFSEALKKRFYSVGYGLRNNQKTSVCIAFIASRLCKPFAPIADFKFKCGDMPIRFYKNIIRYSKSRHGKLRAANTERIVLQYPLFEKFILKQSFCSFVPNFQRQIFARVRHVKRNIFYLVLQHIGKYTNFRGLRYA